MLSLLRYEKSANILQEINVWHYNIEEMVSKCTRDSYRNVIIVQRIFISDLIYVAPYAMMQMN